MGDLTKIDSAQSIEITDGVSQVAALASSAPVGTEVGLVVRNVPSGTQSISGTVTANAGSGTFNVSGTVTANAGSGIFAVSGTVTANAGSGIFAVSGTVTANAGSGTFNVSGTVVAQGDVAHDSPDSGFPVKQGGRAVVSLDDGTIVAANDRTDFVADVDGAQIVRPYAPMGDIISERVTATTVTSTALVSFGALANTRNCIHAIIVYNDSGTNSFLNIRDGIAGTIMMTLPLPAKGGAVVTLPLPLRQPTAGAALAYQLNNALNTAYLTFLGYKTKA